MTKGAYVKARLIRIYPSRFHLILSTSSSGVFSSSASLPDLTSSSAPSTILFSRASPPIRLSLFNFARRVVFSFAAPRVTCHPDLVVYHRCHRVAAAARRIRALQCVSFLRGGEFRGRFAKHIVALVKPNYGSPLHIPLFATSLWLSVSGSRSEY